MWTPRLEDDATLRTEGNASDLTVYMKPGTAM